MKRAMSREAFGRESFEMDSCQRCHSAALFSAASATVSAILSFVSHSAPHPFSTMRRAFPSSCPGTAFVMIIGVFAAMASCVAAPPALPMRM